MTLPATVNWKLLKNVAGVLSSLAVVSFGIPGTVQLTNTHSQRVIKVTVALIN